MVFALHGPDIIAFLSKCLAGVGAHSGIDEEGNIVDVIDKGAYVVVIVTFFVVSALGSQEDVVAPQAEHFGLGIPDGEAFQVRTSTALESTASSLSMTKKASTGQSFSME